MLVSSKTGRLRLVAAFILVASIMASALGLSAGLQATRVQAAALVVAPSSPNDTTSQPLPFSQDWSNKGLITANDDWSGVPGITGYLGDDASTTVAPIDPRTIVTETATVDVNANHSDPDTYTAGGVTEFDGIANPVVALQGSGGSDFPNIVIRINTTGKSNITVAYNLRDIDGSADDAIQPIALQYRVGTSGNFINVPAGYVADATTGPSLATLVTPVNAVLPSAANDQPSVDVRVITGNASGSDEWVGIDDINITGSAIGASTPSSTAGPSSTATQTATASATIGPGSTRIHDIQGAAHISPYSGQSVSGVPGIVIAKKSNGFYLEDPTPDANVATSEGIFVFTSSAPTVNVGDSILVSGTVSEFRPGGATSPGLTITQIGSATVSVVSSGNTLPTPVVIGNGGRIPPSTIIEDDANGNVETSGVFDPSNDGIDFYESLESMSVQVNNAVAVGPRMQFGTTTTNRELPVVADLGVNASIRTARGGLVIQPTDFNPERIILNDLLTGTANLPPANVNDRFPGAIVGVLDYTFNNYKLQVSAMPPLVSGGLTKEVTTPAGTNQLAVGNFNVENLDPTDPQSKFDDLATLIVNNLKAPDLLSIEEIQDNNGATDDGTVAADVTWGKLITAITNAGGPTYNYRQIDPQNDQDGGEPGGNIRQGFLFRTDRGLAFIDRPGATATTDGAVVSDPSGPQLNFSPVRIDPTNAAWASSRKPLVGEFTYRGQKIFFIGNHFASKGGDEPLFGKDQPPVRNSEVKRHQQALLVNNFVNQILAQDANANVIVTGDLNDFQFSETVKDLENGAATGGTHVLNDLIDALPLPEQYTYEFEGNAQVLDHTLVSDHMLNTYSPIDDVVHVNSEFTPHASDHDPQVALFNILAPCTIQFQDVPPSTDQSSFYPFVRCLACRGVLGGYKCGGTNNQTGQSEPCGTSGNPYFRPSNSITRAQIAKVVSNASGFNNPVTGQTFADVPPSSDENSFYVYIERLSQRNVMGGYPCSTDPTDPRTQIEPCDGQNRAYFRPGAFATRGQLAKIVSNAAGFTDNVSGQTFADVPPSTDVSSFYLFVERLASRGVIGGYPCGTTDPNSGPCDAQQRPYFRPNNTVSRAQAAKIVANTFFPNCQIAARP